MRCNERTCILRSMRVPVAATRCRTYVGKRSVWAAPTTSIGAERFLRKPDLQLRDVGASTPSVSFSQNVASSNSRHPEIVTCAHFSTSAVDVDSRPGAVAADSDAGGFAAV